MVLHRSWVIFIIFFMLNFIHAKDNKKELESSKHTIHIYGQKHFEKETLYDVLGVERRSFFAFWKEETPYIKDKLIPSIKDTLKSFYNSEGFYEATFKIKESNTTVDIKIKENRVVKVKKIEIFSDFPIKKYVTLKKDNIFRAKEFVKIKSEIITALLNKGYCSYDLDVKAYVDLKKYSVDVVYRLKKGEFCTFGETVVKGLKSIDKNIIKSRVVAKKGERYDPKKIKESYARVFDLDAFDSIIVSTDRKFYNEVPVDISVSELNKPYHYEIGAGYDTFVGPRVHAMINKRNFLGNAQQITLRTSWSQKEQLITLDFYKPVWFTLFDYGIDFGANIGYSNLEYIGFREKRSFTKTYLESQVGRLNLRAGLALENIDISLIDNFKRNQALSQAVREGNFLLFYPYFNALYDARDSKLNPKYGYYLSAYLEYGLPYSQSASTYVKTLLEARIIHTFLDLTLSSVVKYGVVDIVENSIPESKLLFAGGSFFNRAYGYREIGVIHSSTEDSISGGLSMLNLSFEANYPIWGDLYGAIFSDNTMLTDKSYDFTGQYINSAGLGVRYMTPIGPFKVDVGWNIHDTSQYGISFQIGQSF
jgi:translocation and assembly module TamA